MKNIKARCKLLLAAMLIMIMLTSCGTVPQAQTAEPAIEATQAAETAQAADTPQPEEPAAGEKHQKQVFAMDTVMILTAYGANAEAALDAAEARILELEADLDPESASGSVYALNAGAGSPVTMSEDCYNIMSTTMTYWRLSDGALDPGMYPLSKAWGFINGDYRVLPQTEIDALLAAKNTEGIILDDKTCSATVPAGMEVSFGAVAKGYTAQAVVDLMAEMGVQSAVLSLGGNVQTLGETKPDGSAWRVAVTDPHDTGAYAGVLTAGQTAVVTSGGYQRFFEQDGVTYIHILDPETGRPVENDLLSVTVVTDDGAKADALSTTLFVMGCEAALDFYREQGDFELVLITADDTVIVTPGLRDAFSESSEQYTYEYPD